MRLIRINNPIEVKNTKLSAHFAAQEFACSHCGSVLIDNLLIDKLEAFRTAAGNNPINITSGYRCPQHNKDEGGALSSLHLYGQAADFEMFDRLNGVEMFKLAVGIFPRVGLYQSGINPNQCYMHVDIGKAGTYWLSYLIPVGKNSMGIPTVKRTYVYFNSLDNMFSAMRRDTNRNWFSMVI